MKERVNTFQNDKLNIHDYKEIVKVISSISRKAMEIGLVQDQSVWHQSVDQCYGTCKVREQGEGG